MGTAKCQNSSVERRIKTQRRFAPPSALPRHHHHSQDIPINNHPGYSLPLCSAHQGRKVTNWVLFRGARDRNCSPHSACARRASLLPAPWGTIWQLWEAFWLGLPQPSTFLAQLFLAIRQVVFYTKGMSTQKAPIHPGCFQPCW